MLRFIVACATLPAAVFLTGCRSKHDPKEVREAYVDLHEKCDNATTEHDCRVALETWNAKMGPEKKTTSADAQTTSVSNLRQMDLSNLNRNMLRKLAVDDLKQCFFKFNQRQAKFQPANFGSLQIYLHGYNPRRNLKPGPPSGQLRGGS